MNGQPLRATFLLDPKQKVKSMFVGDWHTGRNVNEILRSIEAFLLSEKVSTPRRSIPANWKVGGETII